MSQPLPTGKFKWVEVKPNEIRKLVKRKDKGYLLEVDVKYPKELHDSHNNLPFMCERMKISGVENVGSDLFPTYSISENMLYTLEPWIRL